MYVHSYDSLDPAINRLRALDQAFQTSCFEWYDGYLYENVGELNGKGKPKPYGKKWVPTKREQRRLDANVQKLEDIKEHRGLKEKLQAISNTGFRDDTEWYPRGLVSSSSILGLPSDIRPDWLAAVTEYVGLLESFYSDPEQYKNDFWYPSDHKVKTEEHRLQVKAGKKSDVMDMDEDALLDYLTNMMSDTKQEPVYVPDPVIKAKLMKSFEKHLKEQRKYLTTIRTQLNTLTAARSLTV